MVVGSNKKASRLLQKLERERYCSIIEGFENDPAFACLMTLFTALRYFNVNFGYVSGDCKCF